MLREHLGGSVWAQMEPIGPKRAQMGPINWAFRANAQNAQLGSFGPVLDQLGPFGTNLHTSPFRNSPLSAP